jgi:hypothetical protein
VTALLVELLPLLLLPLDDDDEDELIFNPLIEKEFAKELPLMPKSKSFEKKLPILILSYSIV